MGLGISFEKRVSKRGRDPEPDEVSGARQGADRPENSNTVGIEKQEPGRVSAFQDQNVSVRKVAVQNPAGVDGGELPAESGQDGPHLLRRKRLQQLPDFPRAANAFGDEIAFGHEAAMPTLEKGHRKRRFELRFDERPRAAPSPRRLGRTEKGLEFIDSAGTEVFDDDVRGPAGTPRKRDRDDRIAAFKQDFGPGSGQKAPDVRKGGDGLRPGINVRDFASISR